MIIGIDLGTTNSTLSYEREGELVPFSITQLSASGTEEKLESLPSFCYFPLKEEIEKGICKELCIGEYARERGSEVPGRVVSSAKSWLCHAGVDRRLHGLPVEADEEQMSPLEACAKQLHYLRSSWDAEHGKENPFNEQQVFITTPASFDPSARQLVQEAASLAEYPEVVLLEEPQAAFYAWLNDHEQWREQLNVGDRVLVVDIGGGTTDFSLIGVEEEEGNLTLNRVAVGSHLLLGGDNMDLALAHLAKAKLEKEGFSVDRWQMQGLVHAARRAKEELLSGEPPAKVALTVAGRGSGLMASSLSTEVTLEEAQQLLVDGFMPLVERSERSISEARVGLQSIALPYAEDPRITCQLATFLSMTGEEEFVSPTAVLFNGGTLKAEALRGRVVEQLNKWSGEKVKELQGANFDFAVSRGAVAYGRARDGAAIRIKSGTAHSYFVGVEQAAPAVPGIQPEVHALCVVPYGMEEGTESDATKEEFSLVLGQNALFRFYQRSTPSEEPVGSVVLDTNQLVELHPIEVALDATGYEGKVVRVKLKSKITELGTLELWCISSSGEGEWKLEFDLRAEATSLT